MARTDARLPREPNAMAVWDQLTTETDAKLRIGTVTGK
jgi:hypothetical protein